MSSNPILDKILEEESNSNNKSSAIPLNNQMDKLTQNLKDANMIHDNTIPAHIEKKEDIQPKELPVMELKENSYENILNELQEHEHSMELAIQQADELAMKTKNAISYYLDINKPNRSGILFQGVPDVLQASARLLDLSISGRYKLASMKKMRAAILKDSKSNNGSGDELTLDSLLAED